MTEQERQEIEARLIRDGILGSERETGQVFLCGR